MLAHWSCERRKKLLERKDTDREARLGEGNRAHRKAKFKHVLSQAVSFGFASTTLLAVSLMPGCWHASIFTGSWFWAVSSSLNSCINMSARQNSAAERRKKTFKKTIDADESRRKREDNIIELRKAKRDESLQKKRATNMGPAAGGLDESDRSNAIVAHRVLLSPA